MTITYFPLRGAAVAAYWRARSRDILTDRLQGDGTSIRYDYVRPPRWRCPITYNARLAPGQIIGGVPCLPFSSPKDGSIRDDHVRPPTWCCRSCFGEMLLARMIARHLRNYKHTDIRTYIFLVAPQTPFPELGLQPSDIFLVAPQTPFPELGLQPSDMLVQNFSRRELGY